MRSRPPLKPGLSGELREGAEDSPRGRQPGCGGKCSGKKRCDKCKSSSRLTRGDALTPLEYLSACELGIQRNDSNYVRGYLRTRQIREDKKCGKSGIADNKKCNKGGGTIGAGTASIVGKVAFAAGAGVGAVALARNPAAQRAVGNAAWKARVGTAPIRRQIAEQAGQAATAARAAAQRGARTANVIARRKVAPAARAAAASAQRGIRAGDVMARRSVGRGGRRTAQQAVSTAQRGARTASVVGRRKFGQLRRRLR